tara:strand:- start:262 stop:456 length:195 start_codon:yes stop_codon:yes gene_type:complete
MMTGAGEVVPVGNPQALADAVLRVLQGARLDSVLAGNLKTQFSSAACAAHYAALFEQMLAEAAG